MSLRKLFSITPVFNTFIRNITYDHHSDLRSIFFEAVRCVRPKALLGVNNKHFNIHDDHLLVISDANHTETIDIQNVNCHLVGFGKAVLGMAVQIEHILGDRLLSGIISVPTGTVSRFADDAEMRLRSDTVIEVHEGAANNLPDEQAAKTAQTILDRCSRMGSDDLLIVLISGGGSALIPLPIPPISIDEKRDLISSLASRQATINEINVVRRAMSQTKGGKLGRAAANACRCISLVISDVCGDPLDIIASGPTITPIPWNMSPLAVLQKFHLFESLPEPIKNVLKLQEQGDRNGPEPAPANGAAYIIGNNELACQGALLKAKSLQYNAIILSTQVVGNVIELSESYARIAKLIKLLRSKNIDLNQWKYEMMDLSNKLTFKLDVVEALTGIVLESTDNAPLCLLAGGEPTVEIVGTGLGGRNQELALRVSALLAADPQMHGVAFLSAGTDGIDGPTSAAGAIGCSQVAADFEVSACGKPLREHLANNNSFNVYQSLHDGKYHIICGHSGTNVMDLHVFLIPL